MNHETHEADLRALLAGIAGPDAATVDLDADLIEALGIDSLAGLRVLAAVEKRFGVRFPDERLGDFKTLRELLDFVGQGGKG